MDIIGKLITAAEKGTADYRNELLALAAREIGVLQVERDEARAKLAAEEEAFKLLSDRCDNLEHELVKMTADRNSERELATRAKTTIASLNGSISGLQTQISLLGRDEAQTTIHTLEAELQKANDKGLRVGLDAANAANRAKVLEMQIDELIADRDEERRAKAWELFRHAMKRDNDYHLSLVAVRAFDAVDAFFAAERMEEK